MPKNAHEATDKCYQDACALPAEPTTVEIDYKVSYEALREKHNELVDRLKSRADGATICLDILKALDGFTRGSVHLPAMFLRGALEETLKQMSLRSPLVTNHDRE